MMLKRLHTLDKHLFLTTGFLSVIIGYAAAVLIIKYAKAIRKTLKTQNSDAKITIYAICFLVLILPSLLYISYSYRQLYDLEHRWKNSSGMLKYLKQNINIDDKVLTEHGAAVVLALYGIVPLPQNVITFDWIDYSGMSDDKAYLQALDDKYFDYIELDNDYDGKEDLKEGIKQKLDNDYSLVYKEGIYEIYKKNEN